MTQRKGRVTIPTDLDVVPQTLEMLDKWGADAIRDCDGTEFPEKLKNTGAKIYATYYTTRKDNKWAKENPDEIQQMYIMTSFHTAVSDTLEIHLMDHLYPDMLAVNTRDDIQRWWEVIDRTTGETVDTKYWSYDEKSGNVVIHPSIAFHEYTVSFLAYIMWDPVHMYNAVVNEWKDVEPQITFDVRQPKTKAHSMLRLRKFLENHDYVDVVRFTTFFHQFTLIFDELAREKYVDWFGYSASVSPYILEQFEKEVGYKFRPEFIIDQGYMNNTYRIPSKEFQDFFPVWDKLTPHQQEKLANTVRYEYAKKGTIIHNGSLDCVGVLLIHSGQLRAYMISEEGREITLFRLFERDLCLFSASCMMPNIQFDTIIEAEKDTDFWLIPPNVYKSVMEASAALANYTNEILSSRFSDVMWLMEQIIWKSFDKRLAEFLIQESDIEKTNHLKITHEKIANHMGTAREVVTRMLRYFQNEGWIRLSRGTIELIHPEKLTALTEN